MLWLRFAIYPGGASRYIKHVDNTLGTDGRRLTAVLYLNRHWSRGAGGEKSMDIAKPASCDVGPPVLNVQILFTPFSECGE